MAACQVKSTHSDQIKHVKQCQTPDISGLAYFIPYLEQSYQACHLLSSQMSITPLSTSLDPYPNVSRTAVAESLYSSSAGPVNLEHVSFL